MWGSHVRALGRLAQAIAIDLPGQGRSSLPGKSSVTEYAQVVLGFLDARGLDRAVVVGHSLGGAIAQSFALAYPDRTAGSE